MDSTHRINPSRRGFLKRTTALTLASVAAPWTLNLAAMAQASAAGANDYKALVCVFLLGGNDYANTLVPFDAGSHAVYQQARPSFAFSRDLLAPTLLTPLADPLDRLGVPHQYALAPGLAPLWPLFNAGKMGVLLNVGPLIQPTSKEQWRQQSVKLPPRLFSHGDQQSLWQAAAPDGAPAGWGGRLGDLLQSSNSTTTFTCINLAGNTLYLSGNTAVQFQMTTSGMVELAALHAPLSGSAAASSALRTLITLPSSHLLEDEYNRISKRAIDAHDVLNDALASAPPLRTQFDPYNRMAAQLQMVARLIGAAPKLGIRRQVFFVGVGDFDTHDGMQTAHPILMASLASALEAFYAATAEMGVADQVTSFTASEFGRTLTSNGNGTDHGWGSMHFVLGGAVKGKRYYGTAPVVASDGPDDIGQGRLLPTTSIEQIGATLGGWLGVSEQDLLTMLPNLSNFPQEKRNLGFV